MSIRYSGVVSLEADDETGAVYIDFDPNDHRERHGLTRKALVSVDYNPEGEAVGVSLTFEDGGL